MKITELIKKLANILETDGDMDVLLAGSDGDHRNYEIDETHIEVQNEECIGFDDQRSKGGTVTPIFKATEKYLLIGD